MAHGTAPSARTGLFSTLLFVLDAVFASHTSAQVQLFDQENDQCGGKDKNHGAKKARR